MLILKMLKFGFETRRHLCKMYTTQANRIFALQDTVKFPPQYDIESCTVYTTTV